MGQPVTLHNSIADGVGHVIKATGGKIVLALPLGLGKPNQFVNELYRRAYMSPATSLTILTALSLTKPSSGADLQQRLLAPFIKRTYGSYVELDYLNDCRKNRLPSNVKVHEFFVQTASELNNPLTQQNYINSNYTHVARDINARGVNVLAQLIACRERNGKREYSLACNPEVALDLLPMLQQRRASGETILLVGQVHHQLPFMENSALVDASMFDVIIDDPTAQTTLFSTPNMPVGMAEHFIGINASALIADGGTLQIGIGALGDAVSGAVLLREQDNEAYRDIVELTGVSKNFHQLIADTGGLNRFATGLYGCSEMVSNGLFKLFEENIIRRRVSGKNGQPIALHGGFFLGPAALYEAMRQLPDERRALIDMTNISFVNGLYGDEQTKREQRYKARFINTAFTVTLLGAVASDQLADGRMLSGVGGQYNFVAQAHELEGARSIILVRATRQREGETLSNIVWNYGHNTIPRHLRDIVVTEYGIADLRGRSDAEVIAALLNITDSRFQPELLEHAKAAGKIAQSYQIPAAFCDNHPQRLQRIFREARRHDLLPMFPVGSDFTYIEEMLMLALTWLRDNLSPSNMMEIGRNTFLDQKTVDKYSEHLRRMDLLQPDTLKGRVYKHLLVIALREIDN